ncbi:hypothetical protein C8T65DRAFT_570848 [Cerioporus squamosus]|nr:hypothetical protein C8T65DRAFT_570848 [Cerioporus squamosus]
MARTTRNSQGQSEPSSSVSSGSALGSTDSASSSSHTRAAVAEPPSTPASATQSVDRVPQGAACLLGVAILENPRLPDPQKQRSIMVDATFWIGTEEAPLSACFRLYNHPDYNLNFSDPTMREKFVVFAMVSKSHEKAEIFSEGSWEDYDLIGDIIWITSARSADAQQRPLMVLSGQTGNIDKKASTFEIVASQYVQQLRQSGAVPASITVPDVPRFKNKKPLPVTDGTNAMVIGFLNSVSRLSTMAAEFFRLRLESVVFYPRAHNIPPPRKCVVIASDS